MYTIRLNILGDPLAKQSCDNNRSNPGSDFRSAENS